LAGSTSHDSVFFTCVSAVGQLERARLLMEAVKEFGGPMAGRPFWVVEADRERVPCAGLAKAGARLLNLNVPEDIGGYLFATKVSACARAEAEASASGVRSLVWVIPESIVLKPPVLFELSGPLRAAVRPVHIQNVGSPVSEQPDAFWSGVYRVAGEPPAGAAVESFIEGRAIRPYFNSAAMSVDPGAGLFTAWLDRFKAAVADRDFQERACSDQMHRIFLHQALLSALVSSRLAEDELRVLPPDYGYPYNLHGEVPVERRAERLDDIVCAIYEERSLDPDVATDIGMSAALGSWLAARRGAGRGGEGPERT
jgi:hypothetical protein